MNQNTGWITKGYDALGTQELYKTTDAGLNWFYQFQNNQIRSIFFYDSLYGWVSGFGSANTQFRTINGGANWITCSFCGVLVSNSLFFLDRNKGWGASIRGINFTSNGGVNWIYQFTPYTNLNYNSVYFTDSLTGWVVGDSGKILKTTTGGIITGINNTSSEIPDKFSLSQNYPNPFNPVTRIHYSLPIGGKVKITIFNSAGQEIKILVNEFKNAGSYNMEFDGSNLSSGVYFYRIEAGSFIQTKKMLLLK